MSNASLNLDVSTFCEDGHQCEGYGIDLSGVPGRGEDVSVRYRQYPYFTVQASDGRSQGLSNLGVVATGYVQTDSCMF